MAEACWKLTNNCLNVRGFLVNPVQKKTLDIVALPPGRVDLGSHSKDRGADEQPGSGSVCSCCTVC